MKKILFLMVVMLVSSHNINAQNAMDFKLQADGTFVNIADNKNFLVIPYEGKTQSELYLEILSSITKLYKSPKDVISKVENEIISIKGFCDDCIAVKTPGMKLRFGMEYVLRFQFKDGKIRVDAPVVSQMICKYQPATYSEPFTDWVNSWKLFKDGQPNPKRQYLIVDLDEILNQLISDILSCKSQDDDW
ncbi:DUF4468 domain-containing protein [Candidatus Bacteroides intestinigallinarum]|jgi:hypothetical protein|uniref:hypothetical protein n=1 Tax=Candidatus Bacteroides intestinigallinarum TaxID=2838470 RepID=UPI0039B6D16B